MLEPIEELKTIDDFETNDKLKPNDKNQMNEIPNNQTWVKITVVFGVVMLMIGIVCLFIGGVARRDIMIAGFTLFGVGVLFIIFASVMTCFYEYNHEIVKK